MLHCVTHWPFCPGVFIAILGFLAAIVTFWEEPPRFVRVICTVIFFALMWCEIWMMSKDRDAHDTEQKEARKLALDQLAQMNLLTLQGIDARGQLADINRKIETAKGNPQLVESLETQAKATRKRIDDISRQLASTTAPAQPQGATAPPPALADSQFGGLRDNELAKLANDTVNEIQEHMRTWKARENDINASSQNQREILEQNGKANRDEGQKLEDYRVRSLKANDDRFGPASKDLFLRANNIRRSLIVRLRQKGIQNPPDKSVDDRFAALAAGGADGYSDQRVGWVCSELSNLAEQLGKTSAKRPFQP
jgi:hypothetical protein